MRISASSPSTALGPSRLPGFSAGVKNTSLKRSRRFSFRSWLSMPNRNSNIGPPRMAWGSFGLPAKPMAIVPPSISRRRSRMRSAAAMPSQGVMACSMPGSFLMKRPPEATMSPSLGTGSWLVWSRRPPSLSPVASAATWVTPMRRKYFPSGIRRSAPLRNPEGIQIRPG